MRKLKHISLIVPAIILFIACEDNPVSDAQKLAALRKVTLTYDSLISEIGLPPGALSGQSLEELMTDDPSTYGNPENYSITFYAHVTAHNTDPDAEDAKFDGMDIDVVMDTIVSNPIKVTTGGFEVEKGKTHPVEMQSTINLQTHRKAGLYIFRQTVDGNDLATTLFPYLFYEIGPQEGTIKLPSLYKDIPTRASEQTKEFLRQLLDSGIFNEE